MTLKLFRLSNLNKNQFLRMYSSNLTCNEVVQFKKVNQVGCILLNRPKQLNALNLPMVKIMQEKLRECESDKDVRAIIVKGAGENAYCAGGDVKTIREQILNGNFQEAMEFFKEEYKLNYMIANCKKPYVAMINGITMGGGVGVSVHGRFRVATEKTLFAMPETAIGFFADVGGSYFLSRLKDHIGIFLVLTGNRLKGLDVKSTGIATHFLNSSKLANLEETLFKETSLTESKLEEILNSFDEKVTAEFNTEKIAKFFAQENLEDIYESLEKDGSEWSKQQLKLLNKMSPLSLKIAVKQLKLGETKSLKECLEMEYQLCQRFGKDSDFSEGVRVVLVDRGDKAKWKHTSFREIDEKTVDWFFEPQPNDDKLILNDQNEKL